MGKKKEETKQQSQQQQQQQQQQSSGFDTRTEMGYSDAVPDTQDIVAYRGFRPEIDPSIPYRFGAARQRVMSTFQNPTGSYYTPELQEQRTSQQLQELTQQEGQAQREAQNDVNRLRQQQLADLAKLTAPTLFTTRQSGTTTGTSSGSTSGSSQGMGTTIGSGGFLNSFLGSLGQGIGGFI